MLFRTLRRRRVWISALVVTSLGLAAWVLASGGPEYTDPSQIPFSEGIPSQTSLHSAPHFGTKVRFLPSVQDACARAALENKLVLLLHLSGRFGSSETT